MKKNIKKISFITMVITIAMLIVFSGTIEGFAADFHPGNAQEPGIPYAAQADTNLKVLKKGQQYTFKSGTGNAVVIHYTDTEGRNKTKDYGYLPTYYEDGDNNLYNVDFVFDLPEDAGDYEYWKITQKYYYNCVGLILTVEPYVYQEPTYELTCNPQKVSKGNYSECTLKTKYYSKIKNISFNLDTDDFETKDVKAGENFENLSVENNNYSLTGKDTLEDSDEGQEITILSFKIISNSDTEIKGNENIKIENINYEDEIKAGSENEVTATVNQIKESKNNKNSLINPLTNNNIIIVLIILGVFITSATTLMKTRNRKN